MKMTPLEQLDHCLVQDGVCALRLERRGGGAAETHSAEMVRGRAAAEDFAAETAH